MPNWPDVTIVICTYDRPRETRETIDSLVLHLKYPSQNLRFLIADDGTEPEDISRHGGYGTQIAQYWYDAWGIGEMPKLTVTNRQGWGANVNNALRAVVSDYVYFTEDDYVLNRDLRLDAYVAMMECAPTIGMVRFGIAGHSLTCHLNEVDIRPWIPDYVEGSSSVGYECKGKINAWVVDKRFSTGPFSFYRYSNRPHLKHRRFHETYGLYPEGLTLAQTEHRMNNQFYDGPDSPYIVCPANWTTWEFDHIGVSRQGTEEDVHAAV